MENGVLSTFLRRLSSKSDERSVEILRVIGDSLLEDLLLLGDDFRPIISGDVDFLAILNLSRSNDTVLLFSNGLLSANLTGTLTGVRGPFRFFGEEELLFRERDRFLGLSSEAFNLLS